MTGRILKRPCWRQTGKKASTVTHDADAKLRLPFLSHLATSPRPALRLAAVALSRTTGVCTGGGWEAAAGDAAAYPAHQGLLAAVPISE